MIDARQKEIGEGSEKIIVEGRLSGRMIENAGIGISAGRSSNEALLYLLQPGAMG